MRKGTPGDLKVYITYRNSDQLPSTNMNPSEIQAGTTVRMKSKSDYYPDVTSPKDIYSVGVGNWLMVIYGMYWCFGGPVI